MSESYDDETESAHDAVKRAGAILADTVEKLKGDWHYLVVAVPPFDPTAKAVTLGVRTSVPPGELPDFSHYIHEMLRLSVMRGMVLTDRPGTGVPS